MQACNGTIRSHGLHVMLGHCSEGGSVLRPQPDAWMEIGNMGEQLPGFIAA